MNTLNYVKLLFSLMITFMIMMGSLMNSFESYLPVFITRTFRYGKFAKNKEKNLLAKMEVPKSWFRHFYFYSSVLSLATLGLVLKVYLLGSVPPMWLEYILDEVGGYFRDARVTSTHTLLGLTLLTVQCLRRLYDTNFVSVFGVDSKMNFSQYMVGYIHYTGAVLAILLEAPVFARTITNTQLQIDHLNFLDYMATILFLWAWYHQYKITVILANLRKNKKGEIVTQKHSLPHGDWFDYLSSPHNTAEMLMYFSLTVILWENLTWLFIFAWVISNQVETALLSHWWYEETFKEFPPKRKALIPFVY